MKKFLKAAAAVLTAAFMITGTGAFTVMAAELSGSGKGSITVNGTGSVKVDPDTASVSLGVNTVNREAKEAQKENAEIMDKVIGKLKSLGVRDDQMKTQNFNVYPNYDYSGDREKITGYSVSNILEVTTKDIDNVAALIDGAAEAGANVNYGISFYVEDPSRYYGEALQQAVKNAGTSAGYIAASLGVNLGKAKSVTEESRGYAYSDTAVNSTMAMAKEEAAADMSAGGKATGISYDKIEITARVSAVYEY